VGLQGSNTTDAQCSKACSPSPVPHPQSKIRFPLFAGAKSLTLQAGCPAGGSAPSVVTPPQGAFAAAAPLAAFVRAAAAETPSVNWSCELQDATASAAPGGKPSEGLPDAYGCASAASLARGPRLRAVAAGQLQPLAAAMHGSQGTTVISGGLGGLGSMVAAVLAVHSHSAADAHLVLLGRSGRAPASNASLQVCCWAPSRKHSMHSTQLTSKVLQPTRETHALACSA
jgi:hypothetical protein